MVADVHFQDKGLDRISDALDGVLKVFRERGVRQIFCLGDMLNTRHQVSVPALSACMTFFSRLVDEFDSVHVVLGNHDMHLKHSRTISSLDALLITKLQPNLRLYKEIELTSIDGLSVLMLPFHEDQGCIQRYLQAMPKHIQNNTVAMGHLAINGATTNKHMGVKHACDLGYSIFENLRHTFTGHFHSHQTLGNVTYIGSPLQFSFSDLNDPQRGGVLYYPDTNTFTHVINPNAVVFLETSIESVIKATGKKGLKMLKTQFAGKYIQVVSQDGMTRADSRLFPKARERLLAAGALDVKLAKRKVYGNKELTLSALLDQGAAAFMERNKIYNSRSYMTEMIRSYLDSILLGEAESSVPEFPKGVPSAIRERHKVLAGEGQRVMDKVNGGFSMIDGKVFTAEIKMLRIENFLGVQGGIVIPFNDIEERVWLLEGENGCGKSTIIEALTWCQFGKFVRSDMAATDAVNDVLDRGCRVRIDYTNGYSIERYRKHKTFGNHGARVYFNGDYLPSYEKGGMQATQQAINDLLGVDYNRFLKTTIYVGNQAANFVSSSALQRREILEEVLGLSVFDEYLELIRARKKETNCEITTIAATITAVTDQIASCENRIEWAKADCDNASNDLKVALQQQINLNCAISSISEKLDSLRTKRACLEEVATLNQDRQRLHAAVASQQQHLAALKDHIADVTVYQEDIVPSTTPATQEDIQDNTVALDTQVAQHDVMMALSTIPNMCPVCEQTLPEGVEHDHSSTIKQRIKHIRENIMYGEWSAAMEGAISAQNILVKTNTEGTSLPNRANYAADVGTETIINSLVNSTTLNIVPLNNNNTNPHSSNTKSEEKRRNLLLRAEETERKLRKAKMNLAIFDERNQAKLKELTNADNNMNMDMMNTCAGMYDSRNSDYIIDDDCKYTNEGIINAEILAKQIRLMDARLGDKKIKLTKVSKTIYEVTAKDTLLGKMMREETKKRSKLIDRVAELNTRMEELTNTSALDKFWEDGFGKKKGSMRNYLLDQSIAELNGILQGVLEHIRGPHDISISFNAELKLSSKYSKRSSGQRKRTDLAIFLALSELSRNHSRYQPGFLLLDELFDSLDAEGRSAVCDLVIRFSERVRHIIVAAPETPTDIQFPLTISVEMTGSGTRMKDVNGLVQCYDDDEREEINQRVKVAEY
eukprot:CFRG0347T1